MFWQAPPTGQLVQSACPQSEKVPAPQGKFCVGFDTDGQATPAGQSVQLVCAATLNVPGRHIIGGKVVLLHREPAGQTVHDVARPRL